jgi:hypothetical protein
MLKNYLIEINIQEDLNYGYEQAYQELLKNGDLDPDVFMVKIQK